LFILSRFTKFNGINAIKITLEKMHMVIYILYPHLKINLDSSATYFKYLKCK
jgi:hypothetical protein